MNPIAIVTPSKAAFIKRDKAVPELRATKPAPLTRSSRASGHDLSAHPANHDQSMMIHLQRIVAERNLTPRFQPIIDLRDASIFGHEGLIRGPSNSPLHSPLSLFKIASEHGLTLEVEHLCRQLILESFAQKAVASKVFLNVSPDCLLQPNMRSGETLRYIQELGLDPRNVIIELTENAPAYDYDLLRAATRHYRDMGFEIAMDDLGEGFSSLRLWSELRPDYVKIDQHFIQGIDLDPVKRQFVRSIQQIAQNSGTKVIAEGIETPEEFSVILDLGIAYGQGYHIGRPQPHLFTELSREIVEAISPRVTDPRSKHPVSPSSSVDVAKLLEYVVPVSRETTNNEVFEMFDVNPKKYSIPVVENGIPIGMINRYAMIDRFARPFRREIFGRHSCIRFMDADPLIIDQTMSLHGLTETIIHMEPYHLANGFIITDQGKYLGMGSGHALLREITQMQLSAARYANPLTLLPGNVAINAKIEELLQSEARFSIGYCDLDHFKPFNDVYGFRKGDEVIQLTAELLGGAPGFLGHIGGDDFILLSSAPFTEEFCQSVLVEFGERIPAFYSAEDQLRGGIEAADRTGNRVVYPMLSLSIGMIHVVPGMFASHLEVAAAASRAKSQAKKIAGNSFFLERRE